VGSALEAVELARYHEGRVMRLEGWRRKRVDDRLANPGSPLDVATPRGTMAGGPGGAYHTGTVTLAEVKLWRESEPERGLRACLLDGRYTGSSPIDQRWTFAFLSGPIRRAKDPNGP